MALRKPFLEAAGDHSPLDTMAFRAVEGATQPCSLRGSKGTKHRGHEWKGTCQPPPVLPSRSLTACPAQLPFAARGAATAPLYGHMGQVGDLVAISGLGLVPSAA